MQLSARVLATACLAGFFGWSVFKYYNYRRSKRHRQLSIESKTPIQLKKLGNDHYIKGNHGEAINYYTQAIELCKKDKTVKPSDLATFYQNRAAAYDVLNKHQECLDDCSAAIENNNKYVKAFVRRAKCYEKLNQYENAISDATTACLLEEFQNQDTLKLTDRILRASSKLKAAKAMETYKPKWPSYTILKGYFASFCQDPIYSKCSTVTIDDLKQLYKEAEDSLSKPPEHDYYFHQLIKATCKALMGEVSQSEVIFDELAQSEECPAHIKANALLKKATNSIAASVMQENDDIEPILTIYEEAIKLQPENPDIYLHRAQAYTLGDKLDKAKKDLDKATELNPRFYSALAQKHYIDFRISMRDGVLSNREIALEHLGRSFKTAMKESPNSVELQSTYAQALMDLGEFESADELYRKVQSKDPKDCNVAVNMAVLYVQWRNDDVKAADLLREAIRIDPHFKYPLEILASMEIQRGKTDEAIKLFEQALDCAKNEFEFANIYSSLDAAKAQKTAFENLGSQL